MLQTVHLLIRGKVQGVFFRATAKQRADEMGIKGWIKNSREGIVEILCTGNEADLKEFINWCKSGPSHAVVKEVIINKVPHVHFETFEIQRY